MIKAGTAKKVINNELGTYIQAAGYFKTVKYIRDDLEANALWLESNGTGMLFISCDLVGMDVDYAQNALAAIAETVNIPKENIIIGCTHTHSGPSVVGPTAPEKPIETEYLERLKNWLGEISRQAIDSAEQVSVAWGKGTAEIGYNRRVCFADGSHKMHGDASSADATGFEGTIDPQHTSLFIRNMQGKIKAVLYNNTAHPINFYGADFLSADFPGLTRKYLRDIFGEISVLFFNGTIGDMSIHHEFWRRITPEPAEQRVARVAHLLTGETLRLLQHSKFSEEIKLGHKMTRFNVGLRKLSEERLEWAKQTMKDYKAGKKLDGLVAPTAYQTLLLKERFGDKTHEQIDLHAGYIDEFAFATVPCEIFCHFGLQLKRRSPFPSTSVFGLVNGEAGYCPTMEGVIGGSWEGTVQLLSRWEEKAGYLIVDELSEMLYELHA
jgi:neutral ceramidase